MFGVPSLAVLPKLFGCATELLLETANKMRRCGKVALVADLFYEQVGGCEQGGSVGKALFELPFVWRQTIILGKLALKCGRAHCTPFRHLCDRNLGMGKLCLKRSEWIRFGGKVVLSKTRIAVIIQRNNSHNLIRFLSAGLRLVFSSFGHYF